MNKAITAAAPSRAYENMYTMTCGANQGLCSAGMSVFEWISGLNRLTQMNTRAIIVLNESIHLYLHLLYTIIPATGMKNEYQRRVSPIVLSGGLSREIHIPSMK